MPVTAEEMLAKLNAMSEKERKKISEQTIKNIPNSWVPSPGPQTEAYFSKADCLLYGGSAGGGKSSLIIGLALTAHRRSLILRRQYTDLTSLVDETLRFNGTRDGFNGSAPPSLKTPDGRLIQFGACAQPGSEEQWQGQAHGLKAYDELTQFLESQVRYIMGWNRSTDPLETRCRTVFVSNPPVDPSGDWVIGMFRPWLDITHHNPAQDGELRWFITDKNGKDVEVETAEPIQDGFRPNGTPNMYVPKSRTFIRSTLDDNPYLVNTDYRATLDAMPEPYRSAMRDGNFMLARKDGENQVIPTAWLREAQQRWTPTPPEGVPMCAIGVDPAGGGKDESILAPRHDGYYTKLIGVPGAQTPFPQDVAALVIRHRKGEALPIIDMGGGYGGGVYKHLEDNGIQCKAHKGSETSTKRTNDRMYGFANKRSEVYWKFREALDPSIEGGSRIALPPDDVKLMADLCAVRFTIGSRGIQLESKDDLKKRLGRSPDRGDAVVMAWVGGDFQENHKGGWKTTSHRPQAVLGYANRRKSR